MSLSTLRKLTLGLVVIFFTFTLGYLTGARIIEINKNRPIKVNITRETPANRQAVDFSLFWRVWDMLEANYFDKEKLVAADMVYGAISGMVQAVGDPYTAFLPPSENKVVQEDLQGNFDGIGIQIGFRGTQLAVISPLPGTPAEKAGVKAGDYIIGIKDEAKDLDRGTVGISLPEAVQAIRGPVGSRVALILLREGSPEPIDVEIVRGTIDVPSVILEFVDGGNGRKVAHLRLLKFGAETYAEWDKAVVEISQKGDLSGVILDLRNNPGGYLQGAIDTASDFLKVGDVVVIQESGSKVKESFKSERVGRLGGKKLVVLVNEGSASASEILAGALRDDNHVKIIGETTFGKGTIQEPLELDGGAGLHITIARWLTPSGFWVNEKGLEPDVKIEDNPETPEDEQLLKAIELLS